MDKGAEKEAAVQVEQKGAGGILGWIDRAEWSILLMAAILLGLAPFVPQPHLTEKLGMLMAGTLSRPIDIFDLVMHATPSVLVIIKALRQFVLKTA